MAVRNAYDNRVTHSQKSPQLIVLGDITRVLFDTKNLRDKEMLLDYTSRLATSDEKKAHHEKK